MIDYIKGTIAELSPAELVLENNGIGYGILISLQTFQALQEKKEAKVYIFHYLREDMEEYYGFATKDERELFELLISVSGIGVASARMMLSSLSAEEIRQAILSEDVARIKSIKGIGVKSAQRMIIELKDKVVKGEGADSTELLQTQLNCSAVRPATKSSKKPPAPLLCSVSPSPLSTRPSKLFSRQIPTPRSSRSSSLRFR